MNYITKSLLLFCSIALSIFSVQAETTILSYHGEIRILESSELDIVETVKIKSTTNISIENYDLFNHYLLLSNQKYPRAINKDIELQVNGVKQELLPKTIHAVKFNVIKLKKPIKIEQGKVYSLKLKYISKPQINFSLDRPELNFQPIKLEELGFNKSLEKVSFRLILPSSYEFSKIEVLEQNDLDGSSKISHTELANLLYKTKSSNFVDISINEPVNLSEKVYLHVEFPKNSISEPSFLIKMKWLARHYLKFTLNIIPALLLAISFLIFTLIGKYISNKEKPIQNIKNSLTDISPQEV